MSRIYEQGENILSDKYITGSLYVNRTPSYYDDIALFASSFTQQDILLPILARHNVYCKINITRAKCVTLYKILVYTYIQLYIHTIIYTLRCDCQKSTRNLVNELDEICW